MVWRALSIDEDAEQPECAGWPAEHHSLSEVEGAELVWASAEQKSKAELELCWLRAELSWDCAGGGAELSWGSAG